MRCGTCGSERLSKEGQVAHSGGGPVLLFGQPRRWKSELELMVGNVRVCLNCRAVIFFISEEDLPRLEALQPQDTPPPDQQS